MVDLPRTRHRLITIVGLGIIVSALSLIALVRIFSVTTEQRLERGKAAVREEVERLAEGRPDEGTTMIGLRAGHGRAAIASLPPEWRGPVSATVQLAAERHAPEIAESSLGAGTLIIYARPEGNDVVWAGYLVLLASFIRTWQIVISALALATLLLVVTTALGLVRFQRSTAALDASLRALGKDLATPIPRPAIRELGVLADGIARLAEDLKQARDKEVSLNRELAEKERLAALGRVVAGVAHEVRNPLASIKLHLDLAAASTTLPPKVDQAVTHASSEIQRLDRLVADLLVVSGRVVGPFRRVDVGELVRSRAAALSPWAAARRVTIRAAGEATAAIDPDAVSRAVDNLLRNAVEAAPPESRVEAAVSPAAGEGSVRIVVSDCGAGVPEERRAELFEPFFTTKPDGTGLGLAICRAIARAHGGELSYARSDGNTRFELCLRDGGTIG